MIIRKGNQVWRSFPKALAKVLIWFYPLCKLNLFLSVNLISTTSSSDFTNFVTNNLNHVILWFLLSL